MKHVAKLLVICAIALCANLVDSEEAEAQLPGTLTAGGVIGYGVETEDVQGYNPYGFTLGLRGGYTLPGLGLHLGGRLMYYFGSTGELADTRKIESKYITVSAEVGYDIDLFVLTLRPYLGFGYASLSSSGPTDTFEGGAFMLAPGATGIIPLGIFFVGADVRYQWLPADGHVDGATFSALLGITL